MRTMVLVCLVAFLSGCMQSGVESESTVKTTTTLTTTRPSATQTGGEKTTTTLECIIPPEEGCVCMQWSCRTQSTVATTQSVTTTTCVIIPDENYVPEVVKKTMTIDNGRFRPSNINANVGDVVIVTITSRQGLHKIRDTFSNNTMIIGPGESREIVFQANEEGVYLLTCNPYCEDPMEATVTIKRPYREVC